MSKISFQVHIQTFAPNAQGGRYMASGTTSNSANADTFPPYIDVPTGDGTNNPAPVFLTLAGPAPTPLVPGSYGCTIYYTLGPLTFGYSGGYTVNGDGTITGGAIVPPDGGDGGGTAPGAGWGTRPGYPFRPGGSGPGPNKSGKNGPVPFRPGGRPGIPSGFVALTEWSFTYGNTPPQDPYHTLYVSGAGFAPANGTYTWDEASGQFTNGDGKISISGNGPSGWKMIDDDWGEVYDGGATGDGHSTADTAHGEWSSTGDVDGSDPAPLVSYTP